MSGVIGGKLKKIAAMLILIILSAACPVRADQQFIMKVGETMAIPCLLEIWSDQSVSLVIGNPEVLMADGSGRAVIALSEGISDVYVHMTNPDTDIRYTFVVEPSETWNYSEEWTLPEETDTGGTVDTDERPHVSDETETGDRGSADGGNYAGDTGSADGGNYAGDRGSVDGGNYAGDTGSVDGGLRVSDEPETDSGTHAGDESHDSSSHVNGTAGIENEPTAGAGTNAQEGEYPDDRADSQAGAVPFWEKRGRGGITFEVIDENISDGTDVEGNLIDDRNAKYTPLAYLKSDGEVAPLFVCASGREVRWKYLGQILFIEASAATAGPYRVGALDSRGNIYFFSS